MRLFDTHAHLDDEQLRPNLDHWLAAASEAGVVGINSIGTNLATSQNCLELAAKHSMVFASVGIHPNYCHEARSQDWPVITQLAKHSAVVGIGETGMDRYWDVCPIEVQREWFYRHIELSYLTQKPLVIHIRESEADVLDVLAGKIQGGQVSGILHSFAGSWETAQQCLEWGMHISFSGIVTYKKSEELREVARRVPLDRILIETDAPYLSPHPVRGAKPNQPAFVRHTAMTIAAVKNLTLAELCEITTQNAVSLFKISSEDLDLSSKS